MLRLKKPLEIQLHTVRHTIKKLKNNTDKIRRMPTCGVSLFHDNTRPHTARLVSYAWDIVTHIFYSPDLVPSDYHIFNKLKEFSGGQQFSNDKNVQEADNMLQKCIDLDGDNIKKY